MVPTDVSFDLASRHPLLALLLEKGARLSVILFAALGINLLLSDALRVEASPGELVLPILFWLAVLTLYYQVKKGFLWGTGLLALGLAGVWYRTGELPFRYPAAGVALLWNRFMAAIDAKGYVSLPAIGEGLTLTTESMLATVSCLSCLVLYVSMHKKTRLFAVVGYMLLVSVPLFVYDLPLRNDGAALILAAVAGILVMHLSEKYTENGASSGVVGATVTLLSFLLLLVPMLRVKEPWREFSAFSGKLEEIRQTITDLAMGKNPFGGSDGGEYQPDDVRDALASDRNFTGKHLITVYSDTVYDVYLRDWVGGTYEDSRWHLPDLDEVEEAYRPFDEEDEYYRVTRLAVQLFQELKGADSESRLGLFRSEATVRLMDKRTGMPLPTGMISPVRSPYGDNRFPPYRFTSDFVYACDVLSAETPYAVDVLLSTRFTTEDYETLVEAILAYRTYVESGILPEEGTLGYSLALRFGRHGLDEALAFVLARDKQAKALYSDKVDNDAIERAVQALLIESDIKQYYRVLSGETESAGENGVITLRDENGETLTYYLSSEAEVLYADEVAYAVASYLREHYRYSLAPHADVTKEAMEDFLYGSGEGYCVQFATAATLMMRRLGFSARYAEGFIATDFSRNNDDAFDQHYAAKVRDRHAHAWAEFWVNGYGWRILDATPGYADEVFETTETEPPITLPPFVPITRPPDTAPGDTDTGTEDGTDSVEYPPETEWPSGEDSRIPPETTNEGEISASPIDPMPYAVGIGSVLFLSLLVVLLAKRGRGRLRQRTDRIAKAKAGCSAEEREALAAAMAHDLTMALGVYRLLPQEGETPTAFGQRADKTLSPYPAEAAPSRGVLALSHRIYGGVTAEEDVMAMALVTEALMKQAPRRLGIFRFFLYRWILCRI